MPYMSVIDPPETGGELKSLPALSESGDLEERGQSGSGSDSSFCRFLKEPEMSSAESSSIGMNSDEDDEEGDDEIQGPLRGEFKASMDSLEEALPMRVRLMIVTPGMDLLTSRAIQSSKKIQETGELVLSFLENMVNKQKAKAVKKGQEHFEFNTQHVLKFDSLDYFTGRVNQNSRQNMIVNISKCLSYEDWERLLPSQFGSIAKMAINHSVSYMKTHTSLENMLKQRLKTVKESKDTSGRNGYKIDGMPLAFQGVEDEAIEEDKIEDEDIGDKNEVKGKGKKIATRGKIHSKKCGV